MAALTTSGLPQGPFSLYPDLSALPTSTALCPDFYQQIYPPASAPPMDEPPPSFDTTSVPLAVPKQIDFCWGKLPSVAVERERAIQNTHTLFFRSWAAATTVSASVTTAIFFKSRFSPIVTLVSFASLALLTTSLAVVTFLNRKPIGKPFTEMREEAGQDLEKGSYSYEDIQKKYQSLMSLGILDAHDINNLVRHQVATMTYEEFVQARGLAILPFLDVENKAMLRPKALDYLIKESEKVGLARCMSNSAARHLGIELQDMARYVVPREATTYEYEIFIQRNGKEALTYLTPYPHLIKKMADSFLTQSYEAMISPHKAEDYRLLCLNDQIIKEVLIKRWNLMSMIDILQTQKHDFELATRNGLVVPQEWTTKILVETAHLKAYQVIALYPAFITQGFLTATSTDGKIPTLRARMERDFTDFPTLQSVQHLAFYLRYGLLARNHPHLEKLVFNYLYENTETYLSTVTEIDEQKLVPASYQTAASEAHQNWKIESARHAHAESTNKAEKEKSDSNIEIKKNEALERNTTDLGITGYQTSLHSAQLAFETAQSEVNKASDDLTSFTRQHESQMEILRDVNNQIPRIQAELKKLNDFSPLLSQSYRNQVNEKEKLLKAKTVEIESHVGQLKAHVTHLKSAAKIAEDKLCAAESLLKKQQQQLATQQKELAKYQDNLSTPERLKVYELSIQALETEIASSEYKAKITELHKKIEKSAPVGVMAAWNEARHGTQENLKKELTALEQKPATLKQLKDAKAALEKLVLEIPSSETQKKWETEVAKLRGLFNQAQQPYTRASELLKDTESKHQINLGVFTLTAEIDQLSTQQKECEEKVHLKQVKRDELCKLENSRDSSNNLLHHLGNILRRARTAENEAQNKLRNAKEILDIQKSNLDKALLKKRDLDAQTEGEYKQMVAKNIMKARDAIELENRNHANIKAEIITRFQAKLLHSA